MNVLINRLSDIVYTDRGVIHGMVSSEVSFNFLSSIIHSTMEKNYWLSDKTAHKLTEFGIFLFNNITSHIEDGLSEKQLNEKYINLALVNFEQIKEFNQSLKRMINYDLQNLYNVDDFFANNGKDSTTYPLYEKGAKESGI